MRQRICTERDWQTAVRASDEDGYGYSDRNVNGSAGFRRTATLFNRLAARSKRRAEMATTNAEQGGRPDTAPEMPNGVADSGGDARAATSTEAAAPEPEFIPLLEDLATLSKHLAAGTHAIEQHRRAAQVVSQDYGQIAALRKRLDDKEQELGHRINVEYRLQGKLEDLNHRVRKNDGAAEEVRALKERIDRAEREARRKLLARLEEEKGKWEERHQEVLASALKEKDGRIAGLEAGLKEVEARNGRLEGESKKAKDDLGAQEMLARAAAETFSQEKEELKVEVDGLKADFIAEEGSLEDFQVEFQRMFKELEGISVKYFNEIPLAAHENPKPICEKITNLSCPSIPLPLSPTLLGNFLRLSHVRTILSKSIFQPLWQPYKSSHATPEQEGLLNLLLSPSEHSPLNPRQQRGLKMLLLTKLASLDGHDTLVQQTTSQLGDALRDLLNGDESAFIEEISKLMHTAIELWYRAQKAHEHISVEWAPDATDAAGWAKASPPPTDKEAAPLTPPESPVDTEGKGRAMVLVPKVSVKAYGVDGVQLLLQGKAVFAGEGFVEEGRQEQQRIWDDAELEGLQRKQRELEGRRQSKTV